MNLASWWKFENETKWFCQVSSKNDCPYRYWINLYKRSFRPWALRRLARAFYLKCWIRHQTLIPKRVAEVLKPTSRLCNSVNGRPCLDCWGTKRFVWLGDKERMIGLCQVAGEVGYSQQKIFSRKLKKKPVLKLKVERLLAVFDTNRFQLQSKQYAKFVFECKLLDGQFQKNQEIADLQFCHWSTASLIWKRITKEQIEILCWVYQGQRAISWLRRWLSYFLNPFLTNSMV